MRRIFAALLLSLFVFSCQKYEQGLLLYIPDTELFGIIESMDATRTSMDENNNVLWSEDDQIVAFMKSTLGTRYQIKEQYVGTTTGGFSKINESSGDDLESGQEIDHNVVLYPYSTAVWCMKNDNGNPTKSYKLNVVLPQIQHYSENSFANGAFPMIAVSSSNQLTFRNICGGVKLQFKGVDKIKSIKLEGIGGELISGKSTVVGYVNGDAPSITMHSGTAAKTVELDCGEGVQLNEINPVTFILAVPPVTFASGMKITVTDTDGMSRTLTNTSSNTVKRSSLLTFPVITYKQEGVFELEDGAVTSYELSAEGGTIEIPVVTNQEYKVVVPESAKDWISVVETKALRKEVVVLGVAANGTANNRSAEVVITSNDGVALLTFPIRQEAGNVPPNNEIWYTSTDGKIVRPYRESAFGVNITSNTYSNGKGVITFDGDVTTVGKEAFSYCEKLSDILFPASVKSLGQLAFNGCTGMTSVLIPDNIVSIDGNVFRECSNISTFTGKYATQDGCALIIDRTFCAYAPASTKYTSYLVPDGVTSIAESAFYGCKQLAEIQLPQSISTIGLCAFYACSNLKKISIPSNVTSIEQSTFYGCANLSEVFLPNLLTKIGDWAFCDCVNLSTLTIPESVTMIGESAFFCSGLTSVVIPDGVEIIAPTTFYNCDKLQSVTIPMNVTYIGSNAFYGCEALSSIYCTPESVPNGGNYDMFSKNAENRKIYVPAKSVKAYRSATYWKSYANEIVGYDFEKGEIVPDQAANEIWYKATEKVSPYNSNVFGANIVSNEWNSTTRKGVITFDADVTMIGEDAFRYCSQLEGIDIPEKVVSIGKRAFYYCSKLKELTIPGSVNAIGFDAFYLCNVIETLNISDLSAWCKIKLSCYDEDLDDGTEVSVHPFSYTRSYNTRLLLNGEDVAEITIPDTITEVGPYTFYGCRNIRKVNVPNSVRTIGSKSFYNCGLESFTFSSYVSTIGYEVLYNCPITELVCNVDNSCSIGSLGKLYYLSSISGSRANNNSLIIGNKILAFAHKSNTKIFTVPEYVTHIADYAFANCNLESMVLHGNLYVGSNAFDGASIGNLNIPCSVRLGYNTFNSCKADKVFIDMYRIEAASEDDFGPFECSNFEEITFGPNVNYLGENSFGSRHSLSYTIKTICFQSATPPEGSSYINGSGGGIGSIYVPSNYLSTYKSDNVWGRYASIMVGY